MQKAVGMLLVRKWASGAYWNGPRKAFKSPVLLSSGVFVICFAYILHILKMLDIVQLNT